MPIYSSELRIARREVKLEGQTKMGITMDPDFHTGLWTWHLVSSLDPLHFILFTTSREIH